MGTIKEKTQPKGWKETTLGEIAKITRGSSPRPIHDFIAPTGMPWIKIADATASQDRFIDKTKEFIKSEGVENSVRVFPGDLIVSNSATPGIPKILHIEACIHDGWLLLRDIKADKYFLFYWLNNSLQKLVHSASGTVFKNLKTDIVKALEILLPPPPEQHEIAGVLSGLDDKIELLRRQNETLEAIARTIFHEWFVFNTNRNWKKGTIGEIVERLNERVGKNDQSKFIVLSAVKTGELVMSEEYFTKRVFSENISKYLKISEGNFAYNPARINIGSIGRLQKPILGAVSPVYVAFGAKQGFGAYMEFLIKTEEIKKYVERFASGSVRQTLNYELFVKIPVSIPDSSTLNKFEDFYAKISAIIKAKEEQTQTLSVVRDTLLPKLMSGEVRVGVK